MSISLSIVEFLIWIKIYRLSVSFEPFASFEIKSIRKLNKHLQSLKARSTLGMNGIANLNSDKSET